MEIIIDKNVLSFAGAIWDIIKTNPFQRIYNPQIESGQRCKYDKGMSLMARVSGHCNVLESFDKFYYCLPYASIHRQLEHASGTPSSLLHLVNKCSRLRSIVLVFPGFINAPPPSQLRSSSCLTLSLACSPLFTSPNLNFWKRWSRRCTYIFILQHLLHTLYSTYTGKEKWKNTKKVQNLTFWKLFHNVWNCTLNYLIQCHTHYFLKY